MLARWAKEDPARTEKARFLAATAELRRGLAARARTRAILRAIQDLPRQIEDIWASPDFTRAERRALLAEIRAALLAADRAKEAAQVDAFLARVR